MVCYLLVECATVWFVGAPRFAALHSGSSKLPGVILPSAGAAAIVVVLWFSVKDAESWWSAPVLGLYWCAIGLATALAASGIAKRVGAALAAELVLPPPAVSEPGPPQVR
jgi:hypothetical protein